MVIMMKKIYETHSVEETIALGKAFCDILDKGVVVALERVRRLLQKVLVSRLISMKRLVLLPLLY